MFPPGFWNLYTIALVTVTILLLGILATAIGWIFITFIRIALVSLTVKKETCVDELFGQLSRESWKGCHGSWVGNVAFHFEPTRATSIQISIDAGDGIPTQAQRDLFRQIEARYSSMWPQIAAALVDADSQLKAIEEVTKNIGVETLELSPIAAGQSLAWTFQYTLDESFEDDESFNDYCAHFVTFEDWKIVDVYAAD